MMPRSPVICLSLAVLATAQVNKDKYVLVGAGACRGNGGTADMVNSKYIEGEHTVAECETECDNTPTCVGFAYSDIDQWCAIYGPEVAGSCSDDTQNTFDKCLALGSCSDSSVECGANCLGMQTVCENLGATWTSAHAVWTGPDDPWSFDSHAPCSVHTFFFEPPHANATTHIHESNGNAVITCYDAVKNDGVAQCTGDFANNTCAEDFEAADTYEIADCDVAGGCTYIPAPRMERIIVPHEPDRLGHGYDGKYMFGMGGACRGTDENGAQVGANSKYSNSCDINGKRKECGGTGQAACVMTQEECEAGCAAENEREWGSCNAYHHGPWCSIFGPNMHEGIGTNDTDPCWFPNRYEARVVDSTNTNAQYICWRVCGGIDGRECSTGGNRDDMGGSDDKSKKKKSGVSRGSIIGVSVVAAVLLIVCIILACALVQARSNQKSENYANPADQTPLHKA